MATIFTHAALPLIGARALSAAPRRLVVTSALVACLPDLDMVGALFDVHARDPWGHRGLTHSLAFAALVTVAVMLVAPPVPRRQLLGWAWIFGCAASHGLLDAMTHGSEPGVALFAPFTDARVLSPFQPIAVSPLGVNEAFGRMGFLVLLNEVLVVWIPAIVFVIGVRSPELHGKLVIGSAAWLAVCVALGLGLPGFFAPLPRELEAPKQPLDWLGPEPVTRWETLRPLLDTELTPGKPLWSSTFFPWWYGGEAGRWQDGRPRLVWRTLTGFEPGDGAALLTSSGRLAPTEKYDLAVGDLGLSATRQALKATHNGSPRYWFGLCNGIAAAAMNEPEPFRTVDVVSPRGDRVRFLPLDVKALLATAYFWPVSVEGPRNSCKYVGLDSGKVCSMNAAAAVVTTLNLLGLRHESFLVDVIPALQAQFYAVASGRVALVRSHENLVDVELQLTLSSTTLGFDIGNRAIDETHYERVGLQPVRFSWPATLQISDAGEIVAGRWTGTPADGPDTMFVVSGGPLTGDAGHLDYNEHLSWPVIQAIARASVDEGAAIPTVDLRDGGG